MSARPAHQLWRCMADCTGLPSPRSSSDDRHDERSHAYKGREAMTGPLAGVGRASHAAVVGCACESDGNMGLVARAG